MRLKVPRLGGRYGECTPSTGDGLGVRAMAMVPTVEGGAERDRAAIEAAYREETLRAVRHRLAVGAGLFLLFVGIVVGLEPVYHPERGGTLRHIYLLELLVCALGLAATNLPRLRDRAGVIAAAVWGLLSLLMIRYNVLVGGQAERCAMFQVCVLTG